MLAPSAARAFSDPKFFYKPVYGQEEDGLPPRPLGGSEGRWFTGSPVDGYACDACHTSRPTLNPKLLPPVVAPRGAALPAGPLLVEGLPKEGYLPGHTYEVRLSWPEYATRARAGFQSGVIEGVMGIVVELVAENGIDSGVLDVSQERLRPEIPAEKCIVPAYKRATQLFRQPLRPYVNDIGATVLADRPASSTCTMRDGTRCLIAVIGCGSELARFLWTTPEYIEGPIWFSAGLVATDHRTSDPQEDAVTLVSFAIPPANAPHYDDTLAADSCSAHPSSRGSAWPALGIGALCMWATLRRRRSA